jgi:hypothetical protein
MSAPRDLPQPRKLYALLQAAPSSKERAQAVADFLCSCTEAVSIHLFFAHDRELTLAVSSPGHVASAELIAEAKRIWDQDAERQPEDQKTKTLDVNALESLLRAEQSSHWQSPTGSYERRLLGMYRDSVWVPVGIAMLQRQANQPLGPVRQAHIESICNALLDSGDVTYRVEPARGR